MKQASPKFGERRSGVLPEGLTIFVVEDDDAARHSLVTSLEALGCTVKTFASCEAFLVDIDQLGSGCLLLDYHFAGMSGLDLLDRLHAVKIFIPTVLFSGRFGAFLKKRAVDYPEVVAVLDKPLDARPLLDALQGAATLI